MPPVIFPQPRLGPGEAGEAHDAVTLLQTSGAAEALRSLPVLTTTGLADNFLDDNQLQPEALRSAMEAIGHPDAGAGVQMVDGYDHSYFFISTFMEEHITWHAKNLGR